MLIWGGGEAIEDPRDLWETLGATEGGRLVGGDGSIGANRSAAMEVWDVLIGFRYIVDTD